MKISHEVPICLLDRSKEFNDYDYLLNHLLDIHPKYKEWYLLNKDRYSILDNSAYEFFVRGEEFNEESFVNNIKELLPNEYMIPDVLMDKDETIKWFKLWNQKYKYLPGLKIAVVQGSTFTEWLECYMFYYENQDKFDKIGISFHYKFLREIGQLTSKNNEDFHYANGRALLIDWLVENNLLMNKPYHLLGSQVGAVEFWWYRCKNYKFIETIDTATPIKFGIVGMGSESFLDKKPNIILDDFVDKQLEPYKEELILRNIKKFKHILENGN